jgi:spermidine synthase
VSIGGAIGALLVGVGAPMLLSGYYELGIALTACAMLLYHRTLAGRWWLAATTLAVVVATAAFTVIGVTEYYQHTRVMVRNFYGVVRTRDYTTPVSYRAMYHGSINHGGQLLDPALRGRPTSYFAPTSGYGRVFASLPEAPRRVGVIGLGAGALAAYARAGDVFRFYEIDPQVAAVAVSEFSYLRDSPAQTDIVLGDGRLSLEREPSQNYDVLAIDAFSGDSIPMHLITSEAMASYLRHLKPDGVIVFQATNRYIDLMPVVKRHANELGLEAVLVSDVPESSIGANYWLSSTDQILVTRDKKLLAHPRISEAATEIRDRPDLPTFTDAHHNLFRILK